MSRYDEKFLNAKGNTGVCPKCYADALLDGWFPIEDPEFLKGMNDKYFS